MAGKRRNAARGLSGRLPGRERGTVEPEPPGTGESAKTVHNQRGGLHAALRGTGAGAERGLARGVRVALETRARIRFFGAERAHRRENAQVDESRSDPGGGARGRLGRVPALGGARGWSVSIRRPARGRGRRRRPGASAGKLWAGASLSGHLDTARSSGGQINYLK